MAQALRLIVFNADEEFGPVLRGQLLACDGVKIVAEVDEPALLSEAVQRFPVDLLVVHLDPFPDALVEVVKELLTHRPDLPCFAVSGSTDGALILAAMRAGFREFLTKPVQTSDLLTALERLLAARVDHEEHGRLLSVISTVGGTGSTTVAVNLGTELAQQQAGQVVLVDLDFRYGQVATFLDLQPHFTIADLCDTPEQLDPHMIEKAVVKHASGVHVLARPHQFAQAEQITAAHAASVLSALQEIYDFVIVDGPSRYDVGGRVVLEMSDMVLLVLQLIVPSVRSADRMLQELGRQGYNLDRLRVVCNRIGRESGCLDLEQVEATLNQKVFATISEDWRSVSTAINMGEPLCSAAARSKARQDIEALARRFVTVEEVAAGKNGDGKGGSLFGRMFGASRSE